MCAQRSTAPRPARPEDPGLGSVVLDDIKQANLQRDYLRELKELYLFYVDRESRTKLASMGRLKGAFWTLGWLVKSLLMKLSPARRVALLAAMIMTAWADAEVVILETRFSGDFRLWAVLILLVVLMLELKDKLLAKDEIQIARQVQLALLPEVSPKVPGWSVWNYSRPANDVGGDLVDYIELDGFRHGIALGDVAGKGLGAALLSSKLQATLRALVPEAASLEDLGRRLNSILYRDGLDNRFATLFYAELEHDSGQLRYLNAGHNPAFVLRPDRVETLEASSYPLGMLAGAAYEEGGVRLDPGDVLLIYSDGLTEAMDEQDQEFGQPRLERLLLECRSKPADQIGASLLTAVDDFLGHARLHDDLSLVIIVRQ